MTIIQAIILGIIEGLTEFLPVSSTGHMIIASTLMGISHEPVVKTFTIVVQLGAILSVVILYRKKFLPVPGSLNSMYSFYSKLIVAFIPAVIFGILFKKYIDILLENVLVVAVALLAGGIIFLFLDNWFRRTEEKGDSELRTATGAFKIGLFQVIAMIPGVSRSAATIIGGLTQGLNKKAAAEFSFFLAVPTMFGATAKDLYDFYSDGGVLNSHDAWIFLLGNAVAFIIAIVAIKSFIGFLTRHGFRVFGYYRILVGLTILIFHFMGKNLTMF